ncbi:MAG: DUF4340 domain-containing protein, partial [Planctomycetota bacterium]|nr:DUF4340 domain-containing protein [Planctomycetota bacterium]
MSIRASLLMLAIALALTAASAMLAWQEEKARRRAGRSQRLFPFAASAVRSATISRGGQILALLRREDDEVWRVANAAGGASSLADDQAVREIYALVELASTARPVPPPAGEPVQMRIGTDEEEVEVKIYLAAPGEVSYIQRAGEPEAYEVAEDLVRVLRRPAAAFRSLELFTWQGFDLDRITIKAPPTEEVVLAR